MRPWPGLLVLLLMVPGAQAGPSDPVLIHLDGHEGTHTVLNWYVQGHDELTGLDLVRVLDGRVDVFPLDPYARSYVDLDVSADAVAQYVLRAEFDGGVTVSNVYDGHCSYVVFGGSNEPGVHVQPECLRDLPVVPSGLQANIKELLSDLLPNLLVVQWNAGR